MVDHLYSAPVMKPLGASGAWLALWPQVLTPRFSAVSMTTLGESTWHVMTSQPASTSAFAASASRTGIDPSPVKITWTIAFGLFFRAPSRTEWMLLRTLAIGLAATKPILFDVVQAPAATPSTKWA